MNEFNHAQDFVDRVTQTTAERRHDQQRQAAERRVKQMQSKQDKDDLRAAAAIGRKGDGNV